MFDALDIVATDTVVGAEVRFSVRFSVVAAADPETANGELCGVMGSVVCFSMV